MRFRKDAKLDPSQVEDYRGRGGRVPGGAPLALGGGGGIIGIIVLVAFLLLSGGGGLGDLGALEGQQVGPGGASQEIRNECQTGEDANTREDCRIVGVVNSVQTYWNRHTAELRAGADAVLRRHASRPAAAPPRRPSGPSTARTTATSISTSASSTSSSRSSAPRAARSPRRTCSPTSTGTMSRT